MQIENIFKKVLNAVESTAELKPQPHVYELEMLPLVNGPSAKVKIMPRMLTNAMKLKQGL